MTVLPLLAVNHAALPVSSWGKHGWVYMQTGRRLAESMGLRRREMWGQQGWRDVWWYTWVKRRRLADERVGKTTGMGGKIWR